MDTEELTAERIALNQSTFRQANQQIESAADRMAFPSAVPFICECPDRTCTEIVRLTLVGYQEVRRHPRRFFNAPGHEAISLDAGAGRVVGRHDGYVVVDKVGEAGEVAEEKYDELKRPGPP